MNSDQEFKNLLQNIITSYEARLKIVGGIIANTHKTLEEFRVKREEISARLREALAKSVNLRKKDFDKMMGEILGIQSGREENIKKILADFHQEEEGVLAKLKSLLEQGDKIKIKDFKKMLFRVKNEQETREKNVGNGVGSEIERLRQEISGLLNHFKKERQNFTLEWQSMISRINNNK